MPDQVIAALGQDMVIYRHDNGVGTVKTKVRQTLHALKPP